MKLTLLLTVFALTPILRAADDKKDAAPAKEPAKEEKAAESAETPATNELPRVSAGDIEAVKKLVEKKAVVYGKVISARAVEKIGMSFLDMDGGKFTVVCWKKSYAKFPEAQSPAVLYKGKSIEITGVIKEYRKTPNSSPQPQIELTDPSQIKVIEDAKDKKDDKAGKKEDPKAGKKPTR